MAKKTPKAKAQQLSEETLAQLASVRTSRKRLTVDRGAAQANAGAMDQVDERQARGNYLAQLRCLLTEDDQERAKKEALEYKF